MCMQAYANELMQCMLSANADDPSSASFQRMEQLVRGHVSDLKDSAAPLMYCLSSLQHRSSRLLNFHSRVIDKSAVPAAKYCAASYPARSQTTE